MTAKARSMAWGRKAGYLVADVEKATWLPVGNVKCPNCRQPKMRYWRKDAFGWGDLWYAGIDGRPHVLVQSTSTDKSMQPRLTASAEFQAYLEAGLKAELHVWTKPSPKGERRTWALRRYDMVWTREGVEARRLEDA